MYPFYFYGGSQHWFLYLVGPMLLALWAQFRVKSAFQKYSRIPVASGITGADAARAILQAARINDVEVVELNGSLLGDHYDPTQKRLSLSSNVYRYPTIAAVGIAAHETGHAIQHAKAYLPLETRMLVVPATQIASRFLPFILFGGLWLHMFGLLRIGVICYAILALFQLITLPVEFDASARAKVILQNMGIVRSGDEAAGVNSMLNAAALTYVAAFVAALGNLLWLLSMTSRNRS